MSENTGRRRPPESQGERPQKETLLPSISNLQPPDCEDIHVCVEGPACAIHGGSLVCHSVFRGLFKSLKQPCKGVLVSLLIVENIKAQRAWVTCPRAHGRKCWANPDPWLKSRALLSQFDPEGGRSTEANKGNHSNRQRTCHRGRGKPVTGGEGEG